MVAAILGAVAEMEAELEGEMAQERTASIVALKRERGQSLGGRPRKIPPGIRERIVAERAAGTPRRDRRRADDRPRPDRAGRRQMVAVDRPRRPVSENASGASQASQSA